MERTVFDALNTWERLLQNTGLTTWPETVRENPRSDCHAWSVTPGIAFLQWILGVQPLQPGFATIRFAPSLGPLEGAEGSVATPAGTVRVRLRATEQGTSADLDSPMPAQVGRRRLPPGRHTLLLSRSP
jgi:hypothetical protein